MRILVIHYSQTGQLTQVIDSFIRPLEASDKVEVVYKIIEPETPFPFPWPVMKFFSIYPESVYMLPIKIKPLNIDNENFDLIILGYQVWFLSPSLPISSFLQTKEAERILDNKPVITVIACRDMWLTAQEKMKGLLKKLNARLIDNVAITDKGGSAFSFLSTPRWMFTGKQKAWGPVPAAGIAETEIQSCERFGQRILAKLTQERPRLNESLLRGLGAVKIKEKMIPSEKIGHRGFLIWSRLLLWVGGPTSRRRQACLYVYIAFLIIAILTVVPITALLKKILSPWAKSKILREKEYYALPSGEDHLILDSANKT